MKEVNTMMLNLNIRDIKIENKKNNSHTKHGRVALPGIRVGVNGIVSAMQKKWLI